MRIVLNGFAYLAPGWWRAGLRVGRCMPRAAAAGISNRARMRHASAKTVLLACCPACWRHGFCWALAIDMQWLPPWAKPAFGDINGSLGVL